ncbi:MAG: hypothetical protein KAQ64_04365 [Candidatus Pacebacteria bacterium]|nr:hypothetical protein [Candidatus Paceibacterota bacterium]
MKFKKLIMLLILTLVFSVNVCSAVEMENSELDVSVIGGTAISYAKEDHLVYGIVKILNLEENPVEIEISISPNRDHYLDDNLKWGNYNEKEIVEIKANEMHIHVFCFDVPSGSNAGKQTWTLNISTEKEIVTKEMIIDLPVTKNVQVNSPSEQPEILKFSFPAKQSSVVAVEADKEKTINTVLKIAGDLDDRKEYNVEIKSETLMDVFFEYPEKITVEMSKPKNWDFDDQEFLPFTVIPGIKFVANVPYSLYGNMHELEFIMEEDTGLKASLPFHLVVTMPVTEGDFETEVTDRNTTSIVANGTVDDNETVTTTEKINEADLPKTVIFANSVSEEVSSEKTENETPWQRLANWFSKLLG